jgi:hypothetical protein
MSGPSAPPGSAAVDAARIVVTRRTWTPLTSAAMSSTTTRSGASPGVASMPHPFHVPSIQANGATSGGRSEGITIMRTSLRPPERGVSVAPGARCQMPPTRIMT